MPMQQFSLLTAALNCRDLRRGVVCYCNTTPFTNFQVYLLSKHFRKTSKFKQTKTRMKFSSNRQFKIRHQTKRSTYIDSKRAHEFLPIKKTLN